MRRRDFITGLGGAAVWPLAARAQQTVKPVVGFLSGERADTNALLMAAFREGLSAAGFVEGKDVVIEYRWAESYLERVPALALDLVRRRVNVILAHGAVPTLVAKGATATIPIVFTSAFDPVAMGYVASLNRPGANVTGVTLIASQLGPKRVELLRELVPKAGVVGLLFNPNNPNTEPDWADAQTAARGLGLQVHTLGASTDQEIEKVFATLAELKADALLVLPDVSFLSRREQLVRLAANSKVPTIYYSREYVAAGGLLSYGASLSGMFRQAGNYVGRILGGAIPADLPVAQPTKFELVINLKTAKTLGLSIPVTLIARADEVIE